MKSKNFAKKIVAVVLASTMAMGLSACGTQKQTDSTATSTAEVNSEADSAAESIEPDISGGWDTSDGHSLSDHEDAKAALEKAAKEDTEKQYEPLAFIGDQVVAGTNYAVLCRVTPFVSSLQGRYSIVYVYEDLDGNASIEYVQDLIGIGSEDGEPTISDPAEGSWEYTDSIDITEDAKKAFDQSAGNNYDAVALLATQTVSGTNYWVLSVPKTGHGIVTLVTVYAPLDGDAEITDTQDMDLGYYGETDSMGTTVE